MAVKSRRIGVIIHQHNNWISLNQLSVQVVPMVVVCANIGTLPIQRWHPLHLPTAVVRGLLPNKIATVVVGTIGSNNVPPIRI